MAAETIRIEIPVTVQDNTGSGLSSITGKLTKMASSAKKTSKLLNMNIKTTGLEKSITGVEKKIDRIGNHKIEIGVSDDASHTIAGVGDAASRLFGMSITIEIGAGDDATPQIADVEDAVSSLNGNTATTEIGAEDNATPVIADAGDSLAALNGNTATTEIGAEDNATPVIADVGDSLSSLNGRSVTVEINASMGANPEDYITQGNSVSSGGGSGGLSLGGSMASGAVGSALSEGRGLVTAAAGIAGMGLGVTSAIQTFGDFESEMSHVKAISGATEDEFASLTEKAKELGATTKFTATESAQAFGFMAMAGWNPEQMEAGIDGVINLAAASGESIASVSDIVTDAMTAFGLSADESTHFADVLAQASASSNTNVSMLGESFKYIAPLAGAMGYSIEDVGLALGLMANAGVKGSMAGTSLRTAISNLSAPTDQMLSAMEKYGISLTDNEGDMKSLAEVMANIRESLGGLAEDEQAAAVKTIFGKNAMSGMLAIINASDEDYQSLADSIGNADGAAERMADTMLDNMQGALTLLSSQWDQVQTSFGERLSPYITAAANALKDALPGVEEKITEIFDGVDEKIYNMTNTKEWTEADFFGKINIAWDTLIADPFREWADSSGASTISDIVGTLFSNAFKTLPGGEEAQLTDWLSLGALVIAGEKIADLSTKVYDLGNKVSGFSWGSLERGGLIAVGIAGAATAIWGVCTAIDAYNEKTIKTSLDEHFGDISLSEDQLQELSKQILDIPMMANVTVSLNELKEVEKLKTDAEEKLKDNDALEYMAKVGVKLSDEENAIYLENAESFIDDVEKSISQSAGALSLIVTSLDIKNEEGEDLGTLIDQWATDDITELNSLSSKYTEAIQDALSKGLTDVDANALVEEYQAKIQEIQDRWAGAERKAATQVARDLLEDSLANLDADSFKGLLEQMREDREAAMETFEQTKKYVYTDLFANQDQLEAKGYNFDDIIEQVAHATEWTKRLSLINDINSITESLYDAYEDEISEWTTSAPEEQKKRTKRIENSAYYDDDGKIINPNEVTTAINDDIRQGYYSNNNADPGLKNMYEAMKPDTTELASIIDEYAKVGKEVPAELMSAYNSAIEVGAAAGDVDAGMQVLANSIAENADQNLIDAIQEGLVGDPTLQSALSRALLTPVEGMEESLDEFKSKMHKNVEEANEIAEKELGQIGGDEQVSPNMDNVFYGGGVTEGYVYGRGTGQTVETETTANATVTPGETDASEVPAAVEEDVQSELDSDPPEADGEADIEVSQTNNAEEVRSEVKSDLETALTDIPVSATANVSVTWTLANGTNSLTSSNGASVDLSVALAHSATGRYVDSPLLSLIGEDGPEYVIPTGSDKRQRGLDLWMQAGEDLGVQGFADGYAPDTVPTGSGNVPVAIGASTNNNANVKFNPKINVSGMDGASLQAALNKKMQEYADSMAGDIADMLAETYENRPVA